MPFSHISRTDRPNHADHASPAGAGSAAIALAHSLLDGAGAAATALGVRIRDGAVGWHRRREAIRELADLDDRMLRDIGLRRADIPFVVEALLDAPPRRTIASAGGPRIEPGRATQVPVGCG